MWGAPGGAFFSSYIRMADYSVSDVEYLVVAAEEDEFDEEVEEHIRDGWQCLGGVSAVAVGERSVRLFQAMTKETVMRASEYREKHGHSPKNGGKRNRKTRRAGRQ